MPKEEEMPREKTTFKPLSGRKFRCNQTSEIVKAGKTASYRRARDMKMLNQGKEKALKKQAKVKQAEKKTDRESVYGRHSAISWDW
ncbi:MAG: hypothetical protein WC120_03515 [Parcubacteria group bacterium]